MATGGNRLDHLDLTEYSPTEYRRIMDVRHGRPFSLDVLIACAPCTGFSQVLPKNRKRDHPKNSLVERCALWVEESRPQVFVMENLPEMVGGKFKRHFAALERRLKSIGYGGTPNVLDFCSLGLPQRRERVIVIFTRKGLPQLSLNDFWRTRSVLPEAVTVRRAIRHLLSRSTSGGRNGDPVHQSPATGLD
jgi:DNA (cytosine-5)-methyltransferase 1